MSMGNGPFPAQRDAVTPAMGRRGVLVVEKKNPWGPRMLALAGFVAVGAMLLLARWVPATPLPDGRAWRISGLDWVACRWHDRSMGTPGMADFKPGVAAWKQRLEREPGSLNATRGYLDSLLTGTASEVSKAVWRAALETAGRLPSMAGTNSSDLGRLLRVSLRVTDRGDEWRRAGRWVDRLPGADLALYLATAADHGDWEEVGAVLTTATRHESHARMARVALKATKAGRDTGTTDLLPELRTASAGGGEGSVSTLRLMMACAVARSDAGLATEALGALRKLGAARLMDYLQEDTLRLGDAQPESGAGRAKDWPPPSEWREVRPWTEWLRRNGETNRAKEALHGAILEWDAPSCWIETTTLVLEGKDWDLAEKLGDRLIGGTRSIRDWDSLGHALRALALDAKGDSAAAHREWERMAKTPLPRHGVVLEWCRAFDHAGRLTLADSWLRTVEGSFGTDAAYWRLRMRSAMATGDTESWMAATTQAAKLAPGDVGLALDRAWGVLVLGRETEEVLRLLQDDAVMLKGGRRGQLLTAWAEARLGRTQKAETLLRLLEPAVKEPTDRSLLAVAWFEALNKAGRIEEAWKAYQKVDLAMLPAPVARMLDREGAALAIRVEKKRKFEEALEEARRRP
ncbi:MAG: Tetratricopeptide repeat [Verrucomicrobiota bacterium]